MIYLDNAATSFPKPPVVYEACDQWLRKQPAAFGRGIHSGSQNASSLVESCRSELSALLGLDSPRNIAFTLNATDSLNLLIRGLLSQPLSTSHRQRPSVIATELDHNSVLRPLHELDRQEMISLTVLPFDAHRGTIDVRKLEATLKVQPARLVVINHASNVLGTVQPVRQLTQVAHHYGALVLLDAAQTAGHIPFSAAELDVDLLAAPGHKGLFGPLGTGFLWIRPGLETEISSLRTGGTGTQSEQLQQPLYMPDRFESGNLNLPGIAGLLAGIRWLRQLSVDQVKARVHELSGRLLHQLREIRGVKIWSPFHAPTPTRAVTSEEFTGILAFTIEGVESQEVAMILDQQAGIASRAGLHCAPLVHQRLGTLTTGGVVRLSPGYFNTTEEIDQTVSVIAEIAASFTS